MKNKVYMKAAAIALGLLMTGGVAYTVMATEKAVSTEPVIYQGVYVGPVDIGGMTKEEARKAVDDYVGEIAQRTIVLQLEGVTDAEKTLTTPVSEMGIHWSNPEVLEEAYGLGRVGNVILRYKMKKDVEHSQVTYELEFGVDMAKLEAYLEANKGTLELGAKDASITKTEAGFVITDGAEGIVVAVKESAENLSKYLIEQWNQEDAEFLLSGEASAPKVTKEMCQKISTTPMGSYTTDFSSSSTSRSGNVTNAVSLINGSVLLPGEKFSCLEHMLPFTEANGYFPAGSYLNGMLVDSIGGGVCQVSTTLYNTVLLAELEVIQRNNHGLTVGYVPVSADAAIAESSNMDLIFANNTNAPIYIEGYTKNKTVTFQIYGYDERPANRKIEFKSEIIEEIPPGEDVVTVDHNLPEGSREVTQKSHTGYRAALYKNVYVDGVLKETIKINTSYYAPAPNYVTVGPGGLAEEPEVDPEVDPNTGEPVTIPVGAPVDEMPETEGEPTQPAEIPEAPVEAPEETTVVPEAVG